MSILERLQGKTEVGKKLFGVIAGQRLGGKTTIAGTLPGRTLLIQAEVFESGSGSAQKLAKRLGNELHVETFSSAEELMKILKELATDEDFDNVVLDSLTAVTEQIDRSAPVMRMKKANIWDAFRMIGETTTECLLALKALTYTDKATKPKNTFVTCALDVSLDKDGNINEVRLAARGNMAVSQITKLGEAVVTVLPPLKNEDGSSTGHRLVTKSVDWWPGRVDSILEDENPGIIAPASLAGVLDLIGK